MQATQEQRRALDMAGRSNCLIAGPGSGKTTTLVEKIRQLLDRDDYFNARRYPKGIVIVTFTQAAASMMRDRLNAVCEATENIRHIGTLHSWARKELRNHGQSYEVADQRQLDQIVEDCLKRMGPTGRRITKEQAWRAALRVPKFGDKRALGLMIRSELTKAKVTSHDIVLEDFCQLVKAGMVEPPNWIFVDEYQDTGPTDAEIYGALHQDGSSLYCIGDPRQAIYGFRGADVGAILKLWDQADERQLLTINHRSTEPICRLSTQVAENLEALEGFDPTIRSSQQDATDQADATAIQIQSYPHHHSEFLDTVEWAAAEAASGLSVAILCRYNSQVQEIRAMLESQGLVGPEREGADDRILNLLKKKQQLPSHYMNRAERQKWWDDLLLSLGLSFAQREPIVHLLRDVMTIEDLEMLQNEPHQREGGAVEVMTIHKAKGCEWDSVCLVGADREAFPRNNQESGRLVFVAISRAKRYVRISHSESRPGFGMRGKHLHGLQAQQWF